MYFQIIVGSMVYVRYSKKDKKQVLKDNKGKALKIQVFNDEDKLIKVINKKGRIL